jgi:hypothetical protein
LEGKCNVPRTVPGRAYQLGDHEKFWVLDRRTDENFQYDFTLLYVTPHTYFWAKDGVDVNKGGMKALMDTFEKKIYPTNREFFGSEWTPGIDEDEHIHVIYTDEVGAGVAGYFNSSDSFNSAISEYSNNHETFIVNTTVDLGNEYAYAVLAHEFVHMTQFPTDRNEDTWMIEGFADMGEFINGYSAGGHDWVYVQDSDLQLTGWFEDASNVPHYGQSFLYLTYFLDRFGEEATRALSANPENGLKSIDDTLASLNITDSQTGKIVTADDVFMDWAAALYLLNDTVGDGRYTYNNYPEAPQTTDTDVIWSCPQSALDRTVNQHGIDYIKMECLGDFTLSFNGSTATQLLPVDAYSGQYAFWSNKGDESDMTLTREFDFTNVNGPITLSYQTWYNIEENWDYLYLEASTDGAGWEIVQTPSGTDYDPTGNAYGWGYTGSTGEWIQEEVDLSKYAGKKVQIRFQYITDAAKNLNGFLLDDVSVDAINYRSDFEAGDGGWVASGFVRIQNFLPQTYRLNLIRKGDTVTVTPVTLDANNAVDIPISLGFGESVTLIVTGTTRFTSIPAAYRVEVK